MSFLDRINPAARSVLNRAAAESARLALPAVGTGELLLSIVSNRNDAASLALRGMGIDLVRTANAIGDERERGSYDFADMRLTGNARTALEGSVNEADSLNSSEIAPMHILLALLRVPNSSARATLRRMELTPDSIEAKLRDMYRPGPTPNSLGTAFERISRDLRDALTVENAPATGDLHIRAIGLRVLVTLLNAQGLTSRLGHRAVGTHHLLFTALDDRRTATHRVLSGMGVQTSDLRLIVRAVERRSNRDSGEFVSGAAQMTLLESVAEARVLRSLSAEKDHLRYCGRPLGRSVVNIDHLILAMTRIDQCVGSLILRSLGLDLDDVRIKIAFALGRTADWESGAGEPPGSLWELLNQQAYRRQVSISGLAARIGTRERILRQWISGTRKPSGKSCDAVAAAFQIDPNLVRRLAGRPPVAMTARRSGGAGEDRRQQLIAEMRTMFNAVDWSEERIARMTTLLRTMVRNDREQAKLNGDELSP